MQQIDSIELTIRQLESGQWEMSLHNSDLASRPLLDTLLEQLDSGKELVKKGAYVGERMIAIDFIISETPTLTSPAS